MVVRRFFHDGMRRVLGLSGVGEREWQRQLSISTGDYVYVANQSTESLAGFSPSSGTLTAVSGSPVQSGIPSYSGGGEPGESHLFVAGVSGLYGTINSYSIGTGGALNLLTSYNTGSAEEVSMDVSPDGQWLVGLDASGPSQNEAIIDVYEINSSTGQLTALTGK